MRLISKKKLGIHLERYDLQISETHNFVAEGIVVHNTNCRLGEIEGVPMAGSHNQRRKQPEDAKNSLYWMPWTLEGVQKFFASYQGPNVILYGEIYGDGVQDLKYGQEKGHKLFRAFDMIMGDQFVSYDSFVEICEKFDIPTVPELWRGAWLPELLEELTGGKSQIAQNQIREGIVIKPTTERWNDNVGRVILKCISDEYLVRKDGTEKH